MCHCSNKMESVLVILWNLPTIIVNHDKSADITGPLHSDIVFLPAKWKNESITRTQPAAALPTIQSCRKTCWGRVGLIDAESFSLLSACIYKWAESDIISPTRRPVWSAQDWKWVELLLIWKKSKQSSSYLQEVVVLFLLCCYRAVNYSSFSSL